MYDTVMAIILMIPCILFEIYYGNCNTYSELHIVFELGHTWEAA